MTIKKYLGSDCHYEKDVPQIKRSAIYTEQFNGSF